MHKVKLEKRISTSKKCLLRINLRCIIKAHPPNTKFLKQKNQMVEYFVIELSKEQFSGRPSFFFTMVSLFSTISSAEHNRCGLSENGFNSFVTVRDLI